MSTKPVKQETFFQEALDCCPCFHLHKCSRAITQAMNTALASTGLSVNQFVVLVAISSEGDVQMSKLANKLVMENSTLSRNIAVLEREGYVSAVSLRPRKVVTLSKKGADALKDSVSVWEEAKKDIVDTLGEDGMREMLQGLNALTETFQKKIGY
jgi:DNA-binding MarR family transcriptional regulator